MDERKFIELYQRQKESGLTIKDFCANEIIAPATFHYWKKKLKECNSLPGFIPLVVSPNIPSSQNTYASKSFPPPTPAANNSAYIEIEFSNKTIIRISSELDLTMLKTLIQLND